MIDSKKKEKIETLLENTFFDDSDKLDWLSKKGFVEAHKCYYYCYYDESGNYIGNDSNDDYYGIIEALLKDIDYDDFMSKFNEDFGDENNG